MLRQDLPDGGNSNLKPQKGDGLQEDRGNKIYFASKERGKSGLLLDQNEKPTIS